jgi:hypothetical protein
LILARISESRNRWYSSSPTLTGLPPYCDSQLVSVHLHYPALTDIFPNPSSTYLRNKNLITLLNTHRYPLALAIQPAGTNSQDLGLVQLLDGGLGQEDAAGCLGLGLDALHEHAVEERGERADGLQSGRLGGIVSRDLGRKGSWRKRIGSRACISSCAPGRGCWERVAYHFEELRR